MCFVRPIDYLCLASTITRVVVWVDVQAAQLGYRRIAGVIGFPSVSTPNWKHYSRKVVLICVLAFSIVFHTVTIERQQFQGKSYITEYVVLLVERFDGS